MSDQHANARHYEILIGIDAYPKQAFDKLSRLGGADMAYLKRFFFMRQ
jgi:hypothetical protein